MHAPGDVVLVSDGDRRYYAKVVGRARAGAYVVDPIRPQADARAGRRPRRPAPAQGGARAGDARAAGVRHAA
jgi:hypothetical protein